MLIDANYTIGQRVKTYRKHLGLSQDELADGICSRQTISILENDQHIPSADILQKIAVRLAIPLREILEDHVRELEIKVQVDIIKVYVESGDFQTALPLIEELREEEDLLEHQRRVLIIAYSECLMRTGKAIQAVELLSDLQQRLEVDRETDDHLMAVLYEKLGTAYYMSNNITSAHANYMRAYQITLRFAEVDVTTAKILFNLGLACRQLNRSADAVSYLQKAEEFFRNALDMQRLANTNFELGIAFTDSGNHSLATKYLEDSLAIYKSLNIVELARRVRQTYSFEILSHRDPNLAKRELLENAKEYQLTKDHVRLSLSYASIASIALRQDETEQAREYIELALRLIPEGGAYSHPHFAFVYQVFAKFQLSISEFEECIQSANLSSDIFGKMGFEREAADSLQLTVQALRLMGRFEEALDVADQANHLLRSTKEQKYFL